MKKINISYYFLNYISAGSVHSVAEALLILLDSTSEPIIPYNLHATCLSAVSYYSQCKQVSIVLLLNHNLFLFLNVYSIIQIISQLPERSKNVFLYLCAFLQELLNHVNDNKLDVKTIG